MWKKRLVCSTPFRNSWMVFLRILLVELLTARATRRHFLNSGIHIVPTSIFHVLYFEREKTIPCICFLKYTGVLLCRTQQLQTMHTMSPLNLSNLSRPTYINRKYGSAGSPRLRPTPNWWIPWGRIGWRLSSPESDWFFSSKVYLWPTVLQQSRQTQGIHPAQKMGCQVWR